jgi:hypothetical protein
LWKWLYHQKQYVFSTIPIKIPMTFLTEIGKPILKLTWKHKRSWITRQSWVKRIASEVSQYLTSHLLQSNSNENSIELAQEQMWRPVEQNRRPRDKSLELQPFNYWQRSSKHMLGKGQPLQQIVVGKLDIYIYKTETRCLSLTLY